MQLLPRDARMRFMMLGAPALDAFRYADSGLQDDFENACRFYSTTRYLRRLPMIFDDAAVFPGLYGHDFTAIDFDARFRRLAWPF